MNYYEHHIGDYAEATAHLSFVEDAAYSRCIRKYYAIEGPLPVDVKAVQRLVGARSKDERNAVDAVLGEFFTLQDDGWHNTRCDEEIARYKDKREKARASAQASVASRKRTNAQIRSERMTAARAKGTHTKEEWEALREFCGFKCCKCGAEGHQDRDHIIPVYQGGSDGIDNIQPLCARCNASKGPEGVDYRPCEWRANVERMLNERSTAVERDSNIPASERSTLQSPVSSLQSEDSLRGEAPSVDQAIYAEARAIFGASIGGQISKAIKLKGKPWILGVIESCRKKDQEQARSYLAAAMNGAKKPDEAEQRRAVIP